MGKYGDTSKTRHSTLKTSWFFFNADIYRILFSPLNYTQATHCRTAYMYVSVRSVSVWFCPSFNLLSIFCRRPLLLPLLLLLLLLRLYFALLDDIHTVFEILLSLHNLVLIQILWPYFVGNFDTHTHKYASIESIGMIFFHVLLRAVSAKDSIHSNAFYLISSSNWFVLEITRLDLSPA